MISPSLERSLSAGEKISGALLLLCAIGSLSYALVTAPGIGKDLAFIQEGAREWLIGTYQFEDGALPFHPPFAIVLFAPLALISFHKLLFIWIVINICAAGASWHFSVRLWGSEWTTATRLILIAMLVSWAPFRVTLRNGQISLIVTAFLLGAMLARKRGLSVLAGALLGLSLIKYSLSFPFFLYVLWKREWRTVIASLLLPAILTEAFAYRMGLSIFDATRLHIQSVTRLQVGAVAEIVGTTEIRPLVLALSGGRQSLSSFLAITLFAAALIITALVLWRAPKCEPAHLAALGLLALWATYHRTYDSVLCLIPAAVLLDWYRKGQCLVQCRYWLVGLNLILIFDPPGLLTRRLGLNESEAGRNPLFWFGVHVERVFVLTMFVWLLMILIDRCWMPVERESGNSPANL